MQKIPTMFVRDESQRGHPVTPVAKPDCAWVLAGEGSASFKLDGQNVRLVQTGPLLADCALFKRQKPKDRDYDEASYVPCSRDEPADRWLYVALDNAVVEARAVGETLEPGIYEAIGPHFQGNPHRMKADTLVRVAPPFALLNAPHVPRTFEALREWFTLNEETFTFGPVEGLVFRHPDGRMAKIKRRDFGLPWPPQSRRPHGE